MILLKLSNRKSQLKKNVQKLILERNKEWQPLLDDSLNNLVFSLNGLHFSIRIEQEFPFRDKDDNRKGLWWGIGIKDSPDFGLKVKWWESVNLDGVDDFYSNIDGYEKIIKSHQEKDKGKKFLGETAKLIVDRINDNVLPVLTMISEQA